MNDELQDLLEKQKSLEREIVELENKKQSLSQEVSDYENQKRGLEDAIAQLKIKLNEVREQIRELKEQDKSKFESYRMVKIGSLLDKLSQTIPSLASEEVRKNVVDIWAQRFATDTLDDKELENQLLLAYFSVKPEDIRELLSAKKQVETSKQEFVRASQNLAETTTEEREVSEITEEDRLLALKYGVRPETIKKLRKGERPSTLLTGNEPVIEI